MGTSKNFSFSRCPYVSSTPFREETKSGFGLPRYTFRNICVENNSVNLDDKTVKVVYNAKAYERVEDPKVRALLRFIQTNEPGEDEYSKRLSEFVEKAKKNEKFRKEYADMNLHDFDIMTEAKEEKALETAENLLKEGDSPEKVSRCVGLPLDQVLELQKELAVSNHAPA